MTKEQLDFKDWIKYGIDMGWCGPPVCHTHDGLPISDIEAEHMEQYEDICIHVVRLYSDDYEKTAVEADHSPSVWRLKPYLG